MRFNPSRSLLVSMCLLAAGCAALPAQVALQKPASKALDPSQPTTLGTIFSPLAAEHAGESGFRLVSAGLDGLTARIEMIDSAERAIDLQSYIFHADGSGNLVAQALMRAAGRGVRVRILVDDAETDKGDERILSLAADPGIEVRIFNPLRYRGHLQVIRGAEFFFGKARLDYRMHNKLLVIDNAVAVIGGRNIGDQYFQIDPQSQFGDDDVLTTGPIVQQLSGVFDEFWNCPMAVPAQAIDRHHASAHELSEYQDRLAAYRQHLDAIRSNGPPAAARTPFADIVSQRAPLVWSKVELAYDSPDKKAVEAGAATGRLIYKPVEERASAVGTELLIVTPYFVPSPDELAILVADRGRRARVRILTNSLEAAPNVAAHSGYTNCRTQLLQKGVELHEVRALLGSTKGSGQGKAISRFGNFGLHGKLYVFDRKALFIGSMNFDRRSKYLNTEIGLLIDSPALSRDVAARFESLTQLENAYHVSIDEASTARSPRLLWTTRRDGKTVSYRDEPARNARQRVQMRLLSLLPLDREL